LLKGISKNGVGMGITFIGILLILVMFVLGYYRGILRIIVAFGALLIASLIATPLSFLTRWMVNCIGAVPLALKPIGSILASGILLFLIFQITGEYFIAKREKELNEKELPPMKEFERYGGALFGALWGFLLILLILTGIDIIGSVQETMNKVTILQAQQNLVKKPGETPSEQSTPEINAQAEEEPPLLRDELKSSIYYVLVKKINPVNEKAQKTLEKLMTVVGDEKLFDRFQNHPVITRLAQNPKIISLSKDEEIGRAIRSSNFKELLNNPRIASLVNDRKIHREFKNVDINAILDEVMATKEKKKAP